MRSGTDFASRCARRRAFSGVELEAHNAVDRDAANGPGRKGRSRFFAVKIEERPVDQVVFGHENRVVVAEVLGIEMPAHRILDDKRQDVARLAELGRVEHCVKRACRFGRRFAQPAHFAAPDLFAYFRAVPRIEKTCLAALLERQMPESVLSFGVGCCENASDRPQGVREESARVGGRGAGRREKKQFARRAAEPRKDRVNRMNECVLDEKVMRCAVAVVFVLLDRNEVFERCLREPLHRAVAADFFVGGKPKRQIVRRCGANQIADQRRECVIGAALRRKDVLLREFFRGEFHAHRDNRRIDSEPRCVANAARGRLREQCVHFGELAVGCIGVYKVGGVFRGCLIAVFLSHGFLPRKGAAQASARQDRRRCGLRPQQAVRRGRARALERPQVGKEQISAYAESTGENVQCMRKPLALQPQCKKKRELLMR